MRMLILMLVTVAGLSACGPQQTSADKDTQQINQLVQEQRDLYTPLLGTYNGTIIRVDGKKEQVQLNLFPETLVVSNPSRYGTTPVPTIGGALTICMTEGDSCFSGKKAADDTNKIPLGQFNGGDYNADTHHLSLYIATQTPQVSATSSSSTTGVGNAQFNVDAIVNNDEIIGKVYSTVNAVPQSFDVKRVK